MGLSDFFSDIYAAFTVTEAHAESPSDGSVGGAQQRGDAGVSGGASTKTPASGTDEESGEEAEANKADAEKAKERTSGGDDESGGDDQDGGDEGGEEPDEEEEEEEEPEDPKEALEEECMNSKQCAQYKHHYDECAERVQKQQEENGKAEEDCVEEFFHLMHCASACAAPKLWKQLK
ncbi:Non-heme 11 kDa protein of cytochrome bc1 complex [Rhizodiscina lignyota]|uniref:Cytochrome b-c1 complex subunit 6, mitochondrial n=1 Tax=Rhizodiscina lignyota TaxID=1504668 RepID=A0A9P4IS35_9PEZI|nr:Non-heme 11 kDa protein of cytochrome bc1 complex [Rhizodiscina lignyota]